MSEIRSPWDHLPPPVVRERREQPVSDPDTQKTPLGRKRKSTANYGQGLDDDWLFHHLIVVGPSEDILSFQEAARGPGIIPWHLDYAAIEEDIFNLTVSQPPAVRGVSVEYCKDQARQFVERVQAREARAAALAVGGRGCPFDLQVLVPIPSDILELGMRHPAAIAWLGRHWGTEHRLLQVATSLEARPGRRIPADNSFLGYRFYTVDHAPTAAVQAIAKSRARLSFTLRSRPARWEKGWLSLIDQDFEEDIAAKPNQVPELALDGFEGPLDLLLNLSRAHRINLAVLSIGDMMDQLALALQESPLAMPLSQKADWVVMASWVLLLRSNLLLPADEPVQIQAEADAAVLRDRLLALQHMKALAGWLDRREVLGRDVFPRGDPEWSGELVQHHRQVDRVAFVWACMELFDERDYALTEGSMYRPAYWDLFDIPGARNRIVRYFSETSSQGELFEFLPEGVKADASKGLTVLRRRSAWTSTFVAMLELAKQGVVELEQHAFMGPIKVQLAATT